ncbi:MAG: NAD-binding protein [Candidatus Hodarchaeota archaeon]
MNIRTVFSSIRYITQNYSIQLMAAVLSILLGTIIYAFEPVRENIALHEAFWDSFSTVLLAQRPSAGLNEDLPSLSNAFSILGIFVIYGIVASVIGKLIADFSGTSFDEVRSWSDAKEQIKVMDQHVIICGLGRVGRSVAVALSDSGIPVVGIDNKKEKIELPVENESIGWIKIPPSELKTKREFYRKIPAIVGEDVVECLNRVNYARADSICVLPGNFDAALYYVMTGKRGNPQANVLTRTAYPDQTRDLLQAGADLTISVKRSGSIELALLADCITKHPYKIDFFIEDTLFISFIAEIEKKGIKIVHSRRWLIKADLYHVSLLIELPAGFSTPELHKIINRYKIDRD